MTTVTKEQLKAVMPKMKNPDLWAQLMNHLMPAYGVDTPERVAMFVAQCAHESMQFNVLEENLNYSKSALNRVFKKYFRTRDAGEYARKPEQIANVVYANRMGNGNTESGDGWRHRGRGIIQLTGYNNYKAFADSVDMSVSEAIQYVSSPSGAMESALWFWKTNDLNKFADKNDVRGATKRINGGYNGLDDRQKYWNKAHEVFVEGAPTHAPAKGAPAVSFGRSMGIGDRGDDVAEMQKALKISSDGIFGGQTHRAVKGFQRKSGLVVDGIAGPKTLSALYK